MRIDSDSNYDLSKDIMSKAIEYHNAKVALDNCLYYSKVFFVYEKIISIFQLIGLLFIPCGILYFLCSQFTQPVIFLPYSYEILKVSSIYLAIVFAIRLLFEIIRLIYLKKRLLNSRYSAFALEAIILFISLLYTLISSFLYYKNYGYEYVIFYGNSYNKEGILAILMYATIFVSALFINWELLKKIYIYVLLAVGLATSVATLLIYFTGSLYTNDVLSVRYCANVFNNSNHYGYFTCIISLLASSAYVFSNKRIKSLISIVLLIPFELCLLISKTLGSNLGFLFGLIIIVVLYMVKYKTISYKLFVLILISSLVFIISEVTDFTDMVKDYSNLNTGITAIAEDATSEAAKKSGSSRWGLWLGTLECIKQSPWLGKGLDCYYNSNRLIKELDMPHNEYLQIASNVGLPVAILYVIAIIITFIRAIKYRHFLSNVNLICLAIMFGYCVSAFFGNTFTYTYPYFLIIWAFAIPKVNTKRIKLEYALISKN